MSEDNGLPINHISKGKTCNGWSNYPTWRVHVEILGDIQWDSDETITVDYLEEIVENVVFDNSGCQGSLVADYARAWLSEVNYYELAEVYNYDRETEQSS